MNNGRLNWLLQRAGGGVTAIFSIFIICWWMAVDGGVSYNALTGLFDNTSFKLGASLTLIAVLGHAWLGLWAVGTDYLSASLTKNDKMLRVYLNVITAIVAGYLLLGLNALWL